MLKPRWIWMLALYKWILPVKGITNYWWVHRLGHHLRIEWMVSLWLQVLIHISEWLRVFHHIFGRAHLVRLIILVGYKLFMLLCGSRVLLLENWRCLPLHLWRLLLLLGIVILRILLWLVNLGIRYKLVASKNTGLLLLDLILWKEIIFKGWGISGMDPFLLKSFLKHHICDAFINR